MQLIKLIKARRTATAKLSIREALEEAGKQISETVQKAEETATQAFEKAKVTVTETAEVISKRATATVKKAKEKTQEVQVAVTRQVTVVTNSIINEENPLILIEINRILGKGEKTTSFIANMQCGLSTLEMPQLVSILNFFKNNGLSSSEILSLDIDDIKAFISTIEKGRLSTALNLSQVFFSIPNKLSSRLTTWYNDAVAVLTIKAGAGSGDINEILYRYVLASSRAIPENNALCLRLIKLALLILTGVPLPRLNTLYQSVLWAGMMGEMAAASTLPSSLAIPASFALLASYSLHLGKQAVSDVTGLFSGNDSTIAPSILDKEETKNESLLWLSVLEVITGHSLTLEDGIRMHETLVVGQSFERILTLKGDVSAFFQALLSPVSADEIVCFLRSRMDPEQMQLDSIRKILDSLDCSQDPTKRLEAAYAAYIGCMKIAVAFGERNDTIINEGIMDRVVYYFFVNCDGGPTEEAFKEGLTWMIINGTAVPEEGNKGDRTLHHLNKALSIIYSIILAGKILEAAAATAAEKGVDWDSVGRFDSASDNPVDFSEGAPAFDGTSFKGGGTREFSVSVQPTGGTIHKVRVDVKKHGTAIEVSCDGNTVNLTTASGNITLGSHTFKKSDLLKAIKSH